VADTHGQARMAGQEAALGPLSPVRTFVSLVAVIAVVTAIGLSARPQAPASRATPLPNSDRGGALRRERSAETAPAPLSPARAATVFRPLRLRLDRAVESLEPARVRSVTTRSGSVRPRSLQVVRSLQRDRLVDRTLIRTTSVRLVAAGPKRATLREKALLRPCLETRGGRDVTKAPAAFTETIQWRLRRSGGVWRLHGARLLANKVTDDRNARC
jgi:hypothetical protein